MKTNQTPPCRCLDCGILLDVARDPFTDDTPRPGDGTICLHCGHLMVFGEKLTLRQLTDAEMVEAAGDERILKIQRARKAMMR